MNESDHPGQGNGGIQSWIDPDLEARIVAAVVGEASDFEMAELDRLLEEKPELAVFKRRIEAIHGLVGESYRAQPVADDEEWRLAPERREQLMNALGSKQADDDEGEESGSDSTAADDAIRRFPRTWKVWVSCVSGVAAALVAVCAIVFSMVQSSRPSVVQGMFGDVSMTAESAVMAKSAIETLEPGEADSSRQDSFSHWNFVENESLDVAQAAAVAPIAEPTVSYSETLKQLAGVTSLGDAESLVAQSARPLLRAGTGGRGGVSRQRAIVPAQQQPAQPDELAVLPQVTTGPVPVMEGESRFAAADASSESLTSLASVVARSVSDSDEVEIFQQPAYVTSKFVEIDSETEAELGFALLEDQVEASPSSRLSEEKQSELFRYEKSAQDQLGDAGSEALSGQEFNGAVLGKGVQVAQNVKDNELFFRSDSRSFDRKRFDGISEIDAIDAYGLVDAQNPMRDESQSDLGVSPSVSTRSGQEVTAEVTREFISPTETMDFVDAKGAAEKPAMPRYQVGEPLPTRGNVNQGYEQVQNQLLDQSLERNTAVELKIGNVVSGPDGFSIDFAGAPEIVEFEGFANYESESEEPAKRNVAAKGETMWGSKSDTDSDMIAAPKSQSASDFMSKVSGSGRGEASLDDGIAKEADAEWFGRLGGANKDFEQGRSVETAPAAQSSEVVAVSGGIANESLSKLTAAASRGRGIQTKQESMVEEKKMKEFSAPVTYGFVVDGEEDAKAEAIVKDLTLPASEALADAAPIAALSRMRASSLVEDYEDLNSSLQEKNTESLNDFGYRFRSIDDLAEPADVTSTNFDVSELTADFDAGVARGWIAGAPAEFGDNGVGGGGEIVERAVELAKLRANAGNRENEEVRETLKQRLAEQPSDEQVRLAALRELRDSVPTYMLRPDEEQVRADQAELIEKAQQLGIDLQVASVEKKLKEQRSEETSAVDKFDAAMASISEEMGRVSGHEVFRDNGDLDDFESKAVGSDEWQREHNARRSVHLEMLRELQEARKEMWKESGKAFAPVTMAEELASENAFSTFSLNVSDVAFKLAQSALTKGEWPEPEKMRVEEFVNALDYGDPAPSPGEKISSRTEQSAHPFMQQRNLLRVAMQTAAVGRGGGQPLRLTIMLDNSGSMQREDREASVRRAMEVLADQLQPNDQVSLLGFARTPRLLADRVSGSDGGKLLAAVDDAPSEGGTNLEEAMRLAAEVAQRQYDDDAVNRIVLMTDGAANLGNADPEELATRVVELRQKGIAFDACGVGAKGLNDEVLEALTRKGDGRYYFLDAPEQADSGFASQLAGALRPAAKNVKVQVVFNPERVGAYRLIGYEKHRLKKEDFRNDKVDAAEMAAEEAGVALYQFEPKADGAGDVGEVRVRFLDVATGRMVEHSWVIPYEESAPSIDAASPSMQLATTAAMLGEYLRGGPEASSVDLETLSGLAPSLRSAFGENVRVNQLIGMIRGAQMAK